MRILSIHNRYAWRGGEDENYEAESRLLGKHDHEVHQLIADNSEITRKGRLAVLLAMWSATWNDDRYEEVRSSVSRNRPDIAYIHNFWFALSPSVVAAAHDSGIPVLINLPNFRLLCVGGTLLDRVGRLCEDCVGHSPLRGVLRRCYHKSFLASFAVARMISYNRGRGTWFRDVDLFTTPSKSCRDILVRGGLPEDRIAVVPNFVDEPATSGSLERKKPLTAGHVVYIGRLSPEKGLRTLLKAWERVEKATTAELRIVGDGPLRGELERLATGRRVVFTGPVKSEQVYDEISTAQVLVLPSECYETFGRVVIEAYACGRPVVVSDIGGPGEIVRNGETGLVFEHGNAEDLAEKLVNLLNDEVSCQRMGQAARSVYLEHYTPDAVYPVLMNCFQQAIENHKNCKQPV